MTAQRSPLLPNGSGNARQPCGVGRFTMTSPEQRSKGPWGTFSGQAPQGKVPAVGLWFEAKKVADEDSTAECARDCNTTTHTHVKCCRGAKMRLCMTCALTPPSSGSVSGTEAFSGLFSPFWGRPVCGFVLPFCKRTPKQMAEAGASPGWRLLSASARAKALASWGTLRCGPWSHSVLVRPSPIIRFRNCSSLSKRSV